MPKDLLISAGLRLSAIGDSGSRWLLKREGNLSADYVVVDTIVAVVNARYGWDFLHLWRVVIT